MESSKTVISYVAGIVRLKRPGVLSGEVDEECVDVRDGCIDPTALSLLPC